MPDKQETVEHHVPDTSRYRLQGGSLVSLDSLDLLSEEDESRAQYIIFLTFHPAWELTVYFLAYFTYVTTLYEITFDGVYGDELAYFFFIDFACLIDLILIIIHRASTDVKAKAPYKPRSSWLLIFDGLALIPISYIYYLLYEGTAAYNQFYPFTMLNRFCRVFRLIHFPGKRFISIYKTKCLSVRLFV